VEDDEQYNWHVLDSALRKYEHFKNNNLKNKIITFYVDF
jgi:hypothetical protein